MYALIIKNKTLMIRKTEAFPLHSTLQKTMQNKAKVMAIERATRSRYLPSIAELFQIWKNNAG